MIKGKTQRLRLSVFRSSKHIYAQLIDDAKGHTLAAADDRKITEKINKTEKANRVGQLIAESAGKLKEEAIKFDRGHFRYHGRIKALAEGARLKGLKF